jgi:hypothetical protein
MATTTTFADLQADFFFAGFSEYNDAGDGLALARRMLNQSYLELCAREHFPWLEDDATGAAPLTIADVRAVISVTNTTQRTPLGWRDRRALLDSYGTLTTAGTPSVWFFDSADTIAVYPTSTADTLAVRYIKKPAKLVNDSDVAIVPDEWTSLIVQGAVLKGKKNDDNYDTLWQIHETEVARMLDAEVYSRGEGPDYIDVRDGGNC